MRMAEPSKARLSPKTKLLFVRCSKYAGPLAAVLVLVVVSAASAFVISHASSRVVQKQPAPGSCHVRGHYPFTMPDLHCTPGALNPAVTQATIRTTICRTGYSSSVRPPTRVTEPEKLASIRAYGLHQGAGSYEYDHLISLELGGAANDPRNLWPEQGASPNLKDKVENYLHARVCDGRMSLASAQRIVALDWVSFYDQNLKPKPKSKPPPVLKPPPPAPPPPPPPPPSRTACYPTTSSGNCYEPGEYCPNDDHGVSGVAGDGEAITCEYNDGWRWEPS
jgi:hypothetical protein